MLSLRHIYVSAIVATLAVSSPAASRNWTGLGDGFRWSDKNNWSPSDFAPRGGDTVRIASNATVVLTNNTSWLGSLTITNAALVFTNWNTQLRATNVLLQNAGRFTLPAAFPTNTMSNRISVACTTFTMETGSTVNADSKGYARDQGPGRGAIPFGGNWEGGGGHGGRGGDGREGAGGSACGSTNSPSLPGSGGASCYAPNNWFGGHGGGAVRIAASGTVTIYGLLSADGGNSDHASGGGAGGSIWISCGTFAGSSNGLIRARGGTCSDTGTDPSGGGGAGGRLALTYSSLSGSPAVRFCASPGRGWFTNDWDVKWHHVAGMGTLYLSDTRLFAPVMTGDRFRDVLLYPGTSRWSVASLLVSNCTFHLAQPGFQLKVTNSVRVDARASLGIGTQDGGTNRPVVDIGQNLVLTNGGLFYVRSARTNAVGPNYGAKIGVTGTLAIAASSWIYPFSNGTNGGSPWFRVGNLLVAAGGGINADAKGYRANSGPGKGTTGGEGWESGGGHGGTGGDGTSGGANGGASYGSTTAPILPGSGSGIWNSIEPRGRGGYGGGTIRFTITNNAVLNGTLSACGSRSVFASGGGAGGSIYLQCRTLAGSGATLKADGANFQYFDVNSCGGGGGGGRISLAYTNLGTVSALRVSAAGGTGPLFQNPHDRRSAQPGTLHFSGTNIFAAAWSGICGRLVIPGFTTWTRSSLSITNERVILPEGFQLQLTGSLVVSGTNAFLAFGTNATITCGGDLVVTNGGHLLINAGATNGTPGACGALVAVTGAVRVASNSWIYPVADPTSGGAPLFRMAQLFVAQGGGFFAEAAGFPSDAGPGKGNRSGSGWEGGASHGGKGGNGTLGTGGNVIYGSSNTPVTVGSGGGSWQPASANRRGGYGGGGIRLESAGRVVVNGTISADGGRADYAAGGGAGGSILITCTSFQGSASSRLSASGARGSLYQPTAMGGGGGGGRISVLIGLTATNRYRLLAGLPVGGLSQYLDHAPYAGTIAVSNGPGYTNSPPGGAMYGSRVFITTNRTLTIRAEPAEYDNPYPLDYATYSDVPLGSIVTNSVSSPVDVENGSRHTCIGWTLRTEHGTLLGQNTNTTTSFTFSSNRIVTWHWTNEYELTVKSGANGSVNSNQVNRWYRLATLVTNITATPSNTYTFFRWTGDVPPGQETVNPLSVTIDRKRTITANFTSTAGQTNIWNGSNTWESVVNWSQGAMPGSNDFVVINSGEVTIIGPVPMRTMTVKNGARVAFSNWNSTCTASNFAVLAGGTVTVARAFAQGGTSNRIHIVCTNLTIQAGAGIEADGKGYLYDNGPGKGEAADWASGAGHGGKGGNSSNTGLTGGKANGSRDAPAVPGSGGGSYQGGVPGNRGGPGGGAIRLEVRNRLTVDGILSADGASGGFAAGGGAGGAIWITCGTLEGTTTGLIRVRGGAGSYSNPANAGGGGGGGRIALYYQSLAAQRSIRFSASPGSGYKTNAGDSAWVHVAEMGTLRLPDPALLSAALTNQLFRNVQLSFGTNAWSIGSLMVSNCWLTLPGDGFRLTVTGDLQIVRGSLGLGTIGGTNCVQLSVGGALSLSQGAGLYVYAGRTNGTTVPFGAEIAVTNGISVGGGCWIYPFAHSQNGGAVRVRAASLTAANNGGINADGKGFAYEQGPGKGTQSGNGWEGGGGHGGKGGTGGYGRGGNPYDSVSAPVLPGSGGGSWQTAYPRRRGGYGGGVIRVDAPVFTLNGVLSADGAAAEYAGGGGAGGSAYVTCTTYGGSEDGVIRARGGSGDINAPQVAGGGGGGGRIALAYSGLSGQPGTRFHAVGGRGYVYPSIADARTAEMGTIWLSTTNLFAPSFGTMSGSPVVPGLTAWTSTVLTVTNSTLGFTNGFRLHVLGDVTIGSTGVVVVPPSGILTCGGNLVVTNGGRLLVFGGPTNELTDYGALVTVAGSMTVCTSSWVDTRSDPVNGGAPLFRAGSLEVRGGGGFAASAAGYPMESGPGKGVNSLIGWPGGGGHGGPGAPGSRAAGGIAYGSSNAPVTAGSGGGSYVAGNLSYCGGSGGGVVRIEVAGPAVINGSLLASGEAARTGSASAGGAGGSILVMCRETIQGAVGGLLHARGAAAATSPPEGGGGGAGGRIALWYSISDIERDKILQGDFQRAIFTNAIPGFLCSVNVNGGTGYSNGPRGTVVFLTLAPLGGTVLLIE